MKRLIPKFVKIEIPGGEYLLHTKPPFIVGKISLCRSKEELVDHLEELKPYVYKIMDSYNICISMWSILDTEPSKFTIQEIINDMLDYYNITKVQKSLKFYDKYKLENY